MPSTLTKTREAGCGLRVERQIMPLARERLYSPADADAPQQKKKERPHHVFDAIERSAAAEKSEGHGNHQREKKHGLEMSEVGAHRASAFAAARRLVSVQRAEQV